MAKSRGQLANQNGGQAIKNAAVEGNMEAVARAAYDLYEQRGRQDGQHLEDWLKAEELVRQKTAA